MLPYTPLHHLLLHDARLPARADQRQRLRRADRLHRRRRALAPGRDRRRLARPRPPDPHPHRRLRRALDRRGRAAQILRRSRGLVPAALALPVACPEPVLACGAELKSTFCLARGARAWVGHHIGDLRTAETLRSYREGVAHFERLFDVAPARRRPRPAPRLPVDRLRARARGRRATLGVQHHHAHLAAVLAEHGETAAGGRGDLRRRRATGPTAPCGAASCCSAT